MANEDENLAGSVEEGVSEGSCEIPEAEPCLETDNVIKGRDEAEIEVGLEVGAEASPETEVEGDAREQASANQVKPAKRGVSRKAAALYAAALAFILALGLAFAWFTDSVVSGRGVISSGNVDIELRESNGLDAQAEGYLADDEYREWLALQSLMPGTSLPKSVWVQNDGSLGAFVRVHVAVPAGANDFDGDEADDILQFAFPGDSGWKLTGTYSATIDGMSCNVGVFTYESRLAAKGATTELISAVKLSESATYAQVGGLFVYSDGKTVVEAELSVPVWVYAEAGQAGHLPWTDPADALGNMLGEVCAADGSYVSPWERDVEAAAGSAVGEETE